MAQSISERVGNDEAPHRDSELTVVLGSLAAQLGRAGETWDSWNGWGRRGLFFRHREIFNGSFMKILPVHLADRSHGIKVMADKSELPRGRYISVEQTFNMDWQPQEQGRVQVYDEDHLHIYAVFNNVGTYTVNGYATLDEPDMTRLRDAEDFATMHAQAVEEKLTHSQPFHN